MNFKVDLIRQTFIIYCAIALSGCLGIYCGFLTLLHAPLIRKSYKFAIFLDLKVYRYLKMSFITVSMTSLISTITTVTILTLFLNVKIRKTFYHILKPIILFNTILSFVNVWSILSMMDPLGYLHTDIQYKFREKMLSYGINNKTKEVMKIKSTIDKIQIRVKCCGIHGPSDWFGVKWLPYEKVKTMTNYQNKFGFISLAPLSCCDRRKALMCSIHDKKPLRHYYHEGCRHKLAYTIGQNIEKTEFVLLTMAIILQAFILLFLKIIYTSLHTMMVGGKYGVDVGIASFGGSTMSTRALELECRGVPLLMPPTTRNITNVFKRQTYIKKKLKIGCLVNGTTYLRSVKESYILSEFQRFLKVYLPIFEAVMFDNDPGYIVVLFRFISKGVCGWLIGQMFLLAMSSKYSSDSSSTLANVCTYTILVTFPYAFMKSTRFRCVAMLILPNLGMKSGRTYLVTELAQITALGPMSTFASNIQKLMVSLHCLMILAQNITADAQRIGLNPMQNLMMRSLEESESVKRLSLDAYSASLSVSSDIKDSGKRAQEIRRQTDQNTTGVSNRQVDLKRHFSRLLTKLDRQEQIKFQRKTARLRQSYNKLKKMLEKTMVKIERYKEMFSNKSTQIESQLRTKLFSACSSIELTKAKMCQKILVGACQKIRQATLYVPIFTELCGNELDSQSSCSIQKALDRAKKCTNDKRGGNTEEGFGAAFRSTDNGLKAMTEIFDFAVRWNFTRPQFNLTGEKLMHGTAVLAVKISDAIRVFVDILVVLFSLLKIMLMLVVLKSFSYMKKYLSNLDFDNIYVTRFFETIDEQRKRDGRASLLPFKKHETRKLIYKQLFYSSSEKKKLLKNAIRMAIVMYSLVIVFITSSVFYEGLRVLDLLAKVELNIESQKLLNMTTRGEGIVKNILDILLEELGRMVRFNITYSLEKCAPRVKPTSDYFKHVFAGLSCVIWALVMVSAYLVRSRHMICAYFFPRRERQRTCHLYNQLLLNRKRYMSTRKNMIIHKIRFNRLELDQSFLLTLRKDYPNLLCGKGKKFAKYKCLICEDTETKESFVCDFDNSCYCARCYSDLDNACLVCLVLQEHLMESRSESSESLSENNYNNAAMAAAQMISDDEDDKDSGADSGDSSEIERMIEDSREVVGWSVDPVESLRVDVEAIKLHNN